MTVEEVWIGLAHVTERPGTNALEGRPGAYVNVLSLASDPDDFRQRISEALAAEELQLDEVEGIEKFRDRASREVLTREFEEAAEEARVTGAVVFDTIYRYLADDDS